MLHFNRISVLAVLLLSGCGGSVDEGDTEALGGAAGNAGSGGASQGGLPGVGGATKTGGVSGLGGAKNVGGKPATGGSPGAGGLTSQGGMQAVGGVLSTGGTSRGKGGTAATGGSRATGGSTSVDARCPATVPSGDLTCSPNGLSCSYNYWTSCLCAPGSAYTCVQADPKCTNAATASAALASSDQVASVAASPMAPPPNRICNCSGAVWVCTLQP